MGASSSEASPWLSQLLAELGGAGFDVNHTFAIDDQVRALFPFPAFERQAALGLLVANTKALWPRFTAWLQVQPVCSAQPVDDYVRERVSAALRCPDMPPSTCYFSQDMDYQLGQGRRGPVPMQKLAALTGLAGLSPVHLNVHPTFGPWLSLRAVVVFDAEPTPEAAPQPQPCAGCHQPCWAPFQAALATLNEGYSAVSVREHWKAWLAVRQSCPIGKGYEFSAAQSEYHYLHSREILSKLRS